jgi:hypothetical protein
MQRLRGRIYLQDGAIQPWEISDDLRHRMEIDERSWHLLVTDEHARISGCARFRTYENTAPLEMLGVRSSALARHPEWAGRLRTGIEARLEEARQRSIGFAEVGGWAIAENRRHTRDALRVALAIYGLAQLLGGFIGLTTATIRHCSAQILRKIGGTGLESDGAALPPYYDPQYRCEMQLLRFDSMAPPARYHAWLDQIRAELEEAPVVCRSAGHSSAMRDVFPAGVATARTGQSHHYRCQAAAG